MSESIGDFWRRKIEEFREGKVKECPVCSHPQSLVETPQNKLAAKEQAADETREGR